MNTSVRWLALGTALTAFSASSAMARERYELTITNGSGMPLSPGALYVSDSQEGVTEVGSSPSAGFVKLCSTGDASGLLTELGAKTGIESAVATPGQVQPGQTIAVEFEARHPIEQSVHFVAMYGKTKDSCSVVDIDNTHLSAVASGGGLSVSGVDKALSTGAFGDPSLPANPDAACASATSGIACIRAIAPAASGTTRFFPGYLSSLQTYLESKYGADDLKTLILNGGSVTYKLRRIR